MIISKCRLMRIILDDLHNGEDLEKVVFRKVLVRVSGVKCPKVVDQNVENTQNQDEQDGAELGLEAYNHHDTSDGADQNDHDTAKAPFASEDESNKEEDEQHATSQLDVHLAVLLVELWQTGWSKLLANPRVGKNHQETTHDRQIAQEEVEVENESVAEGLSDDDTEETSDCILAMLADNDQESRGCHSDNVDDQEEVGKAGWNCDSQSLLHVTERGTTYFSCSRAGR